MNKLQLTIKQKLLLHVLFISFLISAPIITATFFLSDNGRKVVLQGVSEKLQQVQGITKDEFITVKEMASTGITKASGNMAIENVLDITIKNQSAYYEAIREKVSQVAENVTVTLNEQNQTTSDTLDNLLAVSTDSMNRIMEFDNNSLKVLSNMAVLNLNNFQTVSIEGFERLSASLLQHSERHKELAVADLYDLNNLQKMSPANYPIHDFILESKVIAEEFRLLIQKINFAIGQEIENSAIIQDENIEQVITNLLFEKIKINENIDQSSKEVKRTINDLEVTLLSALQERGQETRENIILQTTETKELVEETKNQVTSEIRNNSDRALLKINKTIDDSRDVIENTLESSSKKTIMFSIAISATCTGIALILSFLFITAITEPISAVIKFADKMSRGDLSERLPEGNDEVGVMGRALNVMADELIKLQEATLNSFNQTLDQVIDCVFIFNPDTLQFSYVNQGAMLQIGYTKEEIFQMTPVDINPEHTLNSFMKMIEPLKSGEKDSLFFSTVHETKTGSHVPVAVLLKFVAPPGNDPRFVAIVRDVSETQKIKKEKEMIQTQLLQAQKLESVGQLAAGIAHEINTPTQFIGTNIEFFSDAFNDFNSIINSIENIILDAPDEISQKLKNALVAGDWEYLAEEIPLAIGQSQEGVARVSTIVSAMKSFSHPGTRDMENNDLNAIIETTLIVARSEWKYVATIDKDLDPDLPKVPCLADEMGQVVLNLLVNAAHAIGKKLGENPEGEKGVITITTKKVDKFVELTVRDSGSGIAENALPRIFDPFFTTKEVGKGTGQGLAITHDVVTKKHNGKIELETKIGIGTAFFLKLPLEVGRKT